MNDDCLAFLGDVRKMTTDRLRALTREGQIARWLPVMELTLTVVDIPHRALDNPGLRVVDLPNVLFGDGGWLELPPLRLMPRIACATLPEDTVVEAFSIVDVEVLPTVLPEMMLSSRT